MSSAKIADTFFGIIGDPVKHSASPCMHNAAFAKCGIDAEYITIRSTHEKFDSTVEGVRMSGFGGLNITVPFKKKVIEHLDEVTREGRECNSVNTVRVSGDGKFFGTSTDGPGLVMSLEKEGVELENKNILLVGAGGAAWAVAFSLVKHKGACIMVTNRTEETGRELVSSLKHIGLAEFIPFQRSLLKNLEKPVDILINCTSVGLSSKDRFPLDLSRIGNVPVVVDLIYNPPMTHLLKRAKAAGCKVVNGKGMLLYQGVLAFEFWTGMKAPVTVMRRALDEFCKKRASRSTRKKKA